jgi:hypothetical protein
LIVNAGDEDEIHRQLADDPWVSTEQLVTERIEPWQILVGAERLTLPDWMPPIATNHDSSARKVDRLASQVPEQTNRPESRATD